MTELNFDLQPEPDPRIMGIFRKGEKGFWSPEDDIDWGLPHNSGPPRYFRWAWRGFGPFMDLHPTEREELCMRQYKWVLDQGVHGEMFGILAASYLATNCETAEGRMLACELGMEEARHYEAIHRLASKFGPIGPAHPDVLETVQWAEGHGLLGVFLGLQAGERAGVPSYKLLMRFGGPLFKEVYGRIGNDESRHLAFGVIGIKRHMQEVGLEEASRMAQRVTDGYSYWAFPSPTWEGYGFPEDEVRAYWWPFYEKSRLRLEMVRAFRGIGLNVTAEARSV